MASNSFGVQFRITTFGESHGPGIGVVIDGCPAGIQIDLDQVQSELDRRRPGQSTITTQRKETDRLECLAGLFNGMTTGAPICFFIKNEDARPQDYHDIKTVFRPSHADFTYQEKYGIRDHRGGGRSSARETAARVAAGSVARQMLRLAGIRIQAYVQSIGTLEISPYQEWVPTEMIEATVTRCPDSVLAKEMIRAIENARKSGDSLGGTVACYSEGLPTGLGAPVFDRLEADLAKAMLSINACKGFEIGSGFEGSRMMGSEHNDPFDMSDGKVITRTNYSGGVQGGISNGMPLHFKCAFKPTSTITRAQDSISRDHRPAVLEASGRHDPCVVPRAVPVVEAMTALVLADHWLRSQTDKMDQLLGS